MPSIVIAAVFVAAAFYAGTRYQKHRDVLRQFQFSTTAAALHLLAPGRRLSATAIKAAVPGSNGIANSKSSDSALAPSLAHRKLDTALLPLTIDTVAIPRALGVHVGNGGGIAIVGDEIVIVDVRGAFFKAGKKGGAIDRLEIPPPPNNAELYDRFAAKPKLVGPYPVNSGFRVHDVESQRVPQGIRLFVSYERYLPESTTTSLAISAIVVSEKGFQPLGPWEDIYRGEPLHTEWYSGVASGGRMVVAGGDLYLTVGDYNQDNVFMASRFEAQNPDSDFGKILKIDLGTKVKTLLSMGHRNPQGLTVTANGAIYATEHGPRGGDTLSEIVQGKNFGWPETTLGTHYTTYDWPNRRTQTSNRIFDQPAYAWLPSVAISNLIEVTKFNPAWDNDLLAGSLKDESLHRLRRDGNGRVIYSERIPIGERLRDIGMLPDGTLVLWTDAARLLFVSVDAPTLASNRRDLR